MSEGAGYHSHWQHYGRLLKPFYINNEDELRVGVQTTVAGLVVGVSGMMCNEYGEYSKFTVTVAPTSDRVETVVQNNIGAGWILHARAHLISGTIGSKQVYVNANIVSNTGTPAVPMFVLLSGYLDNTFQPSFPYGDLHSPVEGKGNLRVISGTDQAAGSDITETVPANVRWSLLTFEAAFVASAAVANRRVSLRLDDGTNEFYKVESHADVTAGQTRTFTMYQTGLPSNGNNITFYLPLPIGIHLLPGFRIRTVTSAIDAGDNWGQPFFLVEEWLI